MTAHLLSCPRRAVLVAALTAALPLAAHAQAVVDWSLAATETPAGGPPQRARIEAMASLAVHDALNAIDPRYESYAVVPAAPPGASPDAAVAAAAHRVLVATVPAASAALDTRFANFIAALPPCPAGAPGCIADGIATGEAAAAAMLALRVNDGSATPDLPYAAPLMPGVYQPTPGPAPRFEGWQFVRPFGMRSASQFRAGDNDVMHLSSTTYARDYNEVKQKGSALVRGAAPASDGSDVARFWPGGGGDFNSVTRNVFAARVPDQWALARLFALQQMAIADSAIMVYDTKYHYRFWRPYTAIRWTGGDGNAATTADPDWTPFLPTPPYPDYTCGFTSASGAYFEVLRRFFGTDAVSYTYTAHAPGVVLPAPIAALPPKDITRSFATLSQAVADTVDARVNAGIHFRSGCRLGAVHGAQVGRFDVLHYLRPLR